MQNIAEIGRVIDSKPLNQINKNSGQKSSQKSSD
jgi:hypothetical protein